MRRFYAPLGSRPAWFLDGRPRPEAAEILAALDTGLTVSLFRYLGDVSVGRIDPRDVGFHINVERGEVHPAALVRDALERGTLAAALADAAPALPMYRRLQEALKRYRALSQQFLPLPLPPPAGRKAEPGRPCAGAGALRRVLTAYGDLAPDAAAGVPGLYDAVLAEAVRRFQERHGLAVDRVLGKETLAALNVPPAQRARQIELALERMRGLPDPRPGPVIVINIPEFRLRAFDVGPGRIKQLFAMDVVVGRSLRTRTPGSRRKWSSWCSGPYWNVPSSWRRTQRCASCPTSTDSTRCSIAH
jgi:murein L,D-transpeptidase YcbB/YkuD